MIPWTPAAHDAAGGVDVVVWWSLRERTQDVALLTARDEVDAEMVQQAIERMVGDGNAET